MRSGFPISSFPLLFHTCWFYAEECVSSHSFFFPSYGIWRMKTLQPRIDFWEEKAHYNVVPAFCYSTWCKITCMHDTQFSGFIFLISFLREVFVDLLKKWIFTINKNTRAPLIRFICAQPRPWFRNSFVLKNTLSSMSVTLFFSDDIESENEHSNTLQNIEKTISTISRILFQELNQIRGGGDKGVFPTQSNSFSPQR